MSKSKFATLSGVVCLALLVSIFFSFPSTPTKATTNIGLSINAVLAMSVTNCDSTNSDKLDLTITPISTNNFVSNCQTLEIGTNAPGYELSIKSVSKEDGSNNLIYQNPTTISPIPYIAATTNQLSNPQTIQPNTWGFAITSTNLTLKTPINNFDNSYTLNDQNGKYAKFPNTETTIYETDQLPGQIDNFKFYYGANITNTMLAGLYQTTVTYTATAAEIPEVPEPVFLLDDLSLGKVIHMVGQGGVDYKFIKISGDSSECDNNIDNDTYGNYLNCNIEGNTYWMLADNYCALIYDDANYVTKCNGANYSMPNVQMWIFYSNGCWTDWACMVENDPDGIYQLTLLPMYNDLPNTISGLPKSAVILDYQYDMSYSIDFGWNSISGCPLTNISSAVDMINCTYTSRISLVSVKEWLAGRDNNDYNAHVGTPRYIYEQVRFVDTGLFASVQDARESGALYDESYGCIYDSIVSSMRPCMPWTRTADSYNYAYYIGSDGGISEQYPSEPRGVSPVIWLGPNICYDSASVGSYNDPYELIACSN